ncbi:hypothetical protein AHAS_Ahas17G0144700 [Arachis hypogaea]
MKLCRFTIPSPPSTSLSQKLSHLSRVSDANPSFLPLSASVSLTVSDKLVVGLLRSPISRAFPAFVVIGGSSSSSQN